MNRLNSVLFKQPANSWVTVMSKLRKNKFPSVLWLWSTRGGDAQNQNAGLDFHWTSTQHRRELNICAHPQLIVLLSLSGPKNVFILYIQPWLLPEYLSAFPDSFQEKKPTGTVVSVMTLNVSKGVKWTERHVPEEWQN